MKWTGADPPSSETWTGGTRRSRSSSVALSPLVPPDSPRGVDPSQQRNRNERAKSGKPKYPCHETKHDRRHYQERWSARQWQEHLFCRLLRAIAVPLNADQQSREGETCDHERATTRPASSPNITDWLAKHEQPAREDPRYLKRQLERRPRRSHVARHVSIIARAAGWRSRGAAQQCHSAPQNGCLTTVFQPEADARRG